MKDIFSELYKKVLSFFNSEAKEENSKDTACNRLKLVLMQDRAKMEPALMEKMREEMIEVISKYVEIDKDALGLNLEAEGESFALMLNIPVIRAKTREEIEAAEGLVKDDDDDEDDDIEETDNLDEEESEEMKETDADEEILESETESVDSKSVEEKETETAESVEKKEPTNDEKSSEDIKENVSAQPKVMEKPLNSPTTKNKYKHQKDEDL